MYNVSCPWTWQLLRYCPSHADLLCHKTYMHRTTTKIRWLLNYELEVLCKTWIIRGNMSLYTWWAWRRQWNSDSAYIETHIWNWYVRNTLKVLKCSTAEGCRWSVGPIVWRIEKYCRTPLTRTPVTRIANYPDRLGFWGEFVKNSIKLTCVEIAGYGIKYSRVLWFL